MGNTNLAFRKMTIPLSMIQGRPVHAYFFQSENIKGSGLFPVVYCERALKRKFRCLREPQNE